MQDSFAVIYKLKKLAILLLKPISDTLILKYCIVELLFKEGTYSWYC